MGLFHKRFCKKLAEDAERMIYFAFLRGFTPLILPPMITLNKKRLNDELYKYYSKDHKLVNDLGIRLAKKKAKEYKADLEAAKKVLETEQVFPGYTYAKKNGSWIFRHFDVPYRTHSKDINYRVYVNARIGKLNQFVKEFIRKVLKGKHKCMTCGNDTVNFSMKAEKSGYHRGKAFPHFWCKTCGTEGFPFEFKIHVPSDSINTVRLDKVVMYFFYPNQIISIISIIKSMSSKYFDAYTPHFTHKIRSGVGYSNEPNKQEVADFNEARKESETLISAGDFICMKLAEHFLLLLQMNKTILKNLKNLQKEFAKIGSNKVEIVKEILKQLKPIYRALPRSLESDPAFIEWSKRLKEIEDQLVTS